jgi:hypothetical protein
MKSHRYNGNTTIGSHRQSFIRSPTISTDMESAVPIWSLIGISEQEYNYRFNMPIKIEQEIKEEIKETEIKEEIKEKETEEIKEDIKEEIKDDYRNMTFEPKPSLVRQSKSLRFKTNAPEWV